MPAICRLLLLFLVLGGPLRAASAPDAGGLVREGIAAEERLESRRALEFFIEADRARPNDPFVLQKIAQQYSDLIVELRDEEEKKGYAKAALDYAQRAVALNPSSAVNVLSLAVCHGKLATYSDTRAKLEYSRLVKEEAERAIALDPNYAWAHHLLGRWHYEIATLGGTTKFFVRLIYGHLPAASTREAVAELLRAVALEPGELAHQLELGFALLADGQEAKARAQWEKGLAMPSRKKHDDTAKERARAALEKLKSR